MTAISHHYYHYDYIYIHVIVNNAYFTFIMIIFRFDSKNKIQHLSFFRSKKPLSIYISMSCRLGNTNSVAIAICD